MGQTNQDLVSKRGHAEFRAGSARERPCVSYRSCARSRYPITRSRRGAGCTDKAAPAPRLQPHIAGPQCRGARTAPRAPAVLLGAGAAHGIYISVQGRAMSHHHGKSLVFLKVRSLPHSCVAAAGSRIQPQPLGFAVEPPPPWRWESPHYHGDLTHLFSLLCTSSRMRSCPSASSCLIQTPNS